MNEPRRLPVGAEPRSAGVHFRVWAPRRRRVEVVLERAPGTESVALTPEGNGYFSGMVAQARPGSLYRYRLDDDKAYPDPASRFQPEGPHGPSQVIDPAEYRWRDHAWPGPARGGQVVYEMHIGTFTREGTWQAAAAELPGLARLGITVVEVMPVAEFPGRFNWGYDGVSLFAPTRLYGSPDDFRAFVDVAHAAGMGVILDVVYNHFGPDGAYHREFSQSWFSERYRNEWGEPLNFDAEGSGPVREFFVANAGYWIDEYHLDGLRLDATQQIFDASPVHVVREIGASVRAAARGRRTYVVAESEPQDASLVQPAEQGGAGLDALWNDDFHHAAMVAATGRNEAYYSDYAGTPQELVSAAKWGFLYQGQHFHWQGKRRGSPALGLPSEAFVSYLQNHDQVANSAFGLRLHQRTTPGRYRALTALLLLAPASPMLFQGQEFAASTPFLFFADHKPGLAEAVRKGRVEFVSQFPSVAAPDVAALLPDPGDAATFERCKLDWRECQSHATAYALHQDLLALRREVAAFRGEVARRLDGAVLGAEALVLRFFGREGDDRLLVVNLGRDLDLRHAPEPLLAPPAGKSWATAWSSEHPRYGGSGTPTLETSGGWHVPGHGAFVLEPSP
ncbi:MAG TPA: malto-oligosyltrehalose trehalohydrolase [Usitatibacter sp.]|nr:malto-oligosyltrehalose trehalohydrolase [Usitatibacter sp.]